MSLTAVRPSSLPLPKIISHSSPIERLNLRRKNSCESGNVYHRTSLILPSRTKLTSTSSCSSGSTPTYERQVKSLTPERDFNKRKNSNNFNNKDLRISANNPVSSVHQRSSNNNNNNKTARSNQINNVKSNHINNVKTNNAKVKANNKERANSTASKPTLTHQQPDLVTEAKEARNGQEQQKRRQIQNLHKKLQYTTKGFDAMACMVKYLANDLKAFRTPNLEEKINRLEEIIRQKEAEIACEKRLRDSTTDEISSERDKFRADLDEVIKQGDIKIKKLKEKHKQDLEQALAHHQAELSSLHETRIKDLTQQDSCHSMEIEELTSSLAEKTKEMEEKMREKLLEAMEEKNKEIEKVRAEYERTVEKMRESKKSLEEQVHQLQNEIKEQDSIARAKNKNDLQLQSAHKKMEKITAEVESLKVVLDLKTQEGHALRNENTKLELKMEEFDRIQLDLKKANAAMEDLKEQIQTKSSTERKLSAENRKLSCAIEKESMEKTRLSMEVEELHWKIRQSDSLSMSLIEGPTFTPVKGSTNLSSSFSEGYTTHSLPAHINRESFGQCCISEPGDPESPRVLEVVKKTESVAWKIQYNEFLQNAEQFNNNIKSPGVKRKLSPISPQVTRRQVTSPRLTRSHSLRSSSVGCKAQPVFETLTEFPENNKATLEIQTKGFEGQCPVEAMMGKCEESSLERSHLEIQTSCRKPRPVDFCDLDEDISSSSEIEIGENNNCTSKVASTSLQSYDLHRLFRMSEPKELAGEEELSKEDF